MISPSPSPATRAHHPIESTRKSQRILEAVLGVPFTRGNRIDVLRNGDEIFPAMLQAIAEAQTRIDLCTYVYWKGRIAYRFAEALAERAGAGVEVNVLLDGIGARPMPKEVLEIMARGGVNLERFRNPWTWRLWHISHRTHRKILVCDGRVGFTGGVGIAEEWEGNARNPSEWRETHLRIEGPAVHGLQAAFVENWAETGRPVHHDYAFVRPLEPVGESLVQVIRSSSKPGINDTALMLRTLISLAKERLRLTTAYFVPDRHAIELLCDAATRGVEVDILLPGPHTDMHLCNVAGRAEMQPLLECGVKIWRYQPTMMHAKIMLVDDELSCVGSANFDHRSMYKDEEMSVILLDRRICQTLHAQIDQDIRRSELTSLADWRRRSFSDRLKEWLVQIIKPEL